MKSKFLFFSSIILAILFIAMFGIFYYLKHQEARREFEESGQAKAVMKESDLWPTYHNDAAKIMFSYPPSVTIGTTTDNGMHLNIDVKSLADMPEHAPLGQGTETALPNRSALAAGKFGTSTDFALPASEQVRKLTDNINAQKYLVLSRFEVCSVVMERKLYFFNNGQQITITLSMPAQEVEKQLPEYFTKDKANCGDETIWDFKKQADLYAALKSSTVGGETQKWFDTFDQIINTIKTY